MLELKPEFLLPRMSNSFFLLDSEYIITRQVRVPHINHFFASYSSIRFQTLSL